MVTASSVDAIESVTIGLVGADAFVRAAMDAADALDLPGLRLLPGVYAREEEAGAQAAQLAGRVDAILFAGPLPQHLAASAEVAVPVSAVPVGGTALHAAIASAIVNGALDPARASIDSVTATEVADCYREAGLSAESVRHVEYRPHASPEDYLGFHRELFLAGQTGGAITSIPSVAEALAAEGVPVVMMRPTAHALRQALRTAALVARGARLDDARVAVTVVRVAEERLRGSAPSQYWYQEQRLAVHAVLLEGAREMGGMVVPVDASRFLVIATLGPLRAATAELTVAPFLAAMRRRAELDVRAGVGLGRTAHEAEENAYRALRAADEADDAPAFLATGVQPPVPMASSSGGEGRRPVVDEPDSRARTVLRTILDGMGAAGDAGRVVDAEQVAAALSVTLRTARRTLQALVDAGLAWPLPPERTKKAGRPPRLFRLRDDHL